VECIYHQRRFNYLETTSTRPMATAIPSTTDYVNLQVYLWACWNIPIASSLAVLDNTVYNITVAQTQLNNGTPFILPMQAISELNELSGGFPSQIVGFAIFAIFFGGLRTLNYLAAWLTSCTRAFVTCQLSLSTFSVPETGKNRSTPDCLGIHSRFNRFQHPCLRGEDSCNSDEYKKCSYLPHSRNCITSSRFSNF
jgi:hypothetical protein